MVNVNNNNGIILGTPISVPNLNANNNTTQQKTETKQSSYKSDGYSFDFSKKAEGSVPDVKVGLIDTVGIKFKDVLNTDENIKKFVVFQRAMDSNPDGYLKPGSTDIGKVSDLQKKLKYLGSNNIVVNGTFGDATEKAVINFKKSVGINDGFLAKNGEFAVTSTVTPQMWGILNASVASRLNPNSNINSGNYAPPVTAKELEWAKDFSHKVTKLGFKASPQDTAKYNDIYQRQRMNLQANAGVIQPTDIQPPTPKELAWAKEVAIKKKEFGYTPTPEVIKKYNEIVQRQQLSKQTQVAPTQQATQPVQAQTQILTQENLAWAGNLMANMKRGYQPSPAEESKYKAIFEAQKVAQSAPPTGPVSSQELLWAHNLEKQVAQKFNPPLADKQKYDNIFARYKSEGVEGKISKPSDDDLKWAKDLEIKVNTKGYQASPDETNKYNNIKSRLDKFNEANGVQAQGNTETQAPQGQANGVSQAELDWARSFDNRIKTQNYKPSQDELNMYNDIYARAQASGVIQTQQAPTQQVQRPQPQVQTTQDDNLPDINGNNEVEVQPNVSVDITKGDPDLTWALNLLDRVTTQNYQPNPQEMQKYEEIIARNQTVQARP